ncbi:MAG: nucleotidyltransferase family protein [Acidobacteriota bacterium]|jgi:hypothetical protein|nr:nucleotidyltransferase family protein [Acidobacteriota bacterium]
MTTDVQARFLALLRAGLWGGAPGTDAFAATPTDWRELRRLADRQSVLGLVYDGIAALPAPLRPQTPLLRQWYAQVVRIEHANLYMDEALAELCRLYRAIGLRPVLLKGQGVARCYANPLRRQCGDIDLYVGRRGFRGANEIVLAADSGNSAQDARPKTSPKHALLRYRGVVVENHRIVAQLHDRRSRRHFAAMVAEQLEAPAVPGRRLALDGCEVVLPPARFDAVFLLLHLFVHFLPEGVGVRQICDWARLLHVYRAELDRDKLREDVAALGLGRPWAVFGHIAVACLGLPRDEFPSFDGRDPQTAEAARQVLDMVFDEGNFGFFNGRREERPAGFFGRKLHSYRWKTRRFRKLEPLFPGIARKTRWQWFRSGLWGLVTLRRPE